MSTTTTKAPTAEQLATYIRAAELKAAGTSFKAIGTELGVSDKTAARYVAQGQPLLEEREAKLAQAKPTKPRKPRKPKATAPKAEPTAPKAKTPKARKAYADELAERVIEMRDEESASWAQIADELDLGTPGKARRVYRNAKDAAGQAVPIGAPLGLVGRGGRLPWVNTYPESLGLAMPQAETSEA